MNCATPSGGRYPNEIPAVSNDAFAWGAGVNSQSFQLNFMKSRYSGMARPVVTTLKLEFNGLYTTGVGASLRAAQLAQTIERVYIRDADGDRVLCSGAALLHFMRFDRLAPFVARDLAQNTASQARRWWLEIPIEPWFWTPEEVANPSSYRWDARSLAEGGEVTIDFSPGATIGATTNLATIVSGTCKLRAMLLDEGTGKVSRKTRAVIKAFDIAQAADNYGVSGSLLHAHMWLGRVAEAKATPDVWAAQQLTSNALRLNAVDDFWLNHVDEERREFRRTAPNLTADEDDGNPLGSMVSLFQPRKFQPMTELPALGDGGLDVSTNLTFNSGTLVPANKPQMLMKYIVDRPSQCGPAEGLVNTNGGRMAAGRAPAFYARKFEVIAPPGSITK